MGRNLTGYILVGPVTLSDYTLDEARCHLRKIKIQTDVAGGMLAASTLSIEHILEADGAGDDPKLGLLNEVMEEAMQTEGDYDDTFDTLKGFADDPDSILVPLKEMWSEGAYRSVMIRQMPGDPTKQIVVSAIESWGDGFENGDSGWYINWGFWLDIMGLLDINVT